MNRCPALLLSGLLVGFSPGCADRQNPPENSPPSSSLEQQEIGQPGNQQPGSRDWRSELSDLEYHVLREDGTERAFSGDLWDMHEDGDYICRGCGQKLFRSTEKFDSGTGWPSFWQPVAPSLVIEEQDLRLGLPRTEVSCSNCGGHLGHVFKDGPQPTGLRYCINSVSLDFVARADGQ